jgi:hypothetical protein
MVNSLMMYAMRSFCYGFVDELQKLGVDVTETAPSKPGAVTFRAKQDRTYEMTPKKDLSFAPSERPRPAVEIEPAKRPDPPPLGRRRSRLDFWSNRAGQKGIKLVLPFGR